jgi:hypothetical protein
LSLHDYREFPRGECGNSRTGVKNGSQGGNTTTGCGVIFQFEP